MNCAISSTKTTSNTIKDSSISLAFSTPLLSLPPSLSSCTLWSDKRYERSYQRANETADVMLYSMWLTPAHISPTTLLSLSLSSPPSLPLSSSLPPSLPLLSLPPSPLPLLSFSLTYTNVLRNVSVVTADGRDAEPPAPQVHRKHRPARRTSRR